MTRDPGLYLEDILESIEKIEEYSKGISEEAFNTDLQLQDAIIRRFEIIGEAVKHTPESYKTTNPQIPWREIAGMRDVLTHGYFEVDVQRVWNTLKKDLPEFKKELQKLEF